MKIFVVQVLFFKVMMLMSMTGMAGTIDTVGQEPYEQCGYCHEYDGNSLMPSYPKLAGQMPGYIKKQLRDFRSGKRIGQMQATAELLTDEDIEVVANYFSQQKIRSNTKPIMTKDDHDMASRLFLKGDKKRAIAACSSCHGAKGQGFRTIPRLAGQHQNYLVEQLNDFKSGKRSNDEQGIMAELSKKLRKEEIMSLSQYLSALSVHQQTVMNADNAKQPDKN